MKIGAIFPTCEIGDDPAFIRDWTQAAEGLGYSHIVCYDHVVGAEHHDRTPPLMGPYTEKDPFHEPFVVMAYMAALTKRIELASGVLILPQRQTVLVAKQAAELQLLSEGRFRMGVGMSFDKEFMDLSAQAMISLMGWPKSISRRLCPGTSMACGSRPSWLRMVAWASVT